MDATTKKNIDLCVNIIKEATFGKDSEVWRVLTARKEISKLIGSSSIIRIKAVQEGIKQHPNIIYRLNKSSVGRKPLEYRYVSEEEKANYEYQYPLFNFLDDNEMEYIKRQLGETINIQTVNTICRFVDALASKKAKAQWIKLNINDFAKSVCYSLEDVKQLFSFMIENKILLGIESESIYRAITSEMAYEQAMEELEEPEKIKDFVSLSFVKVKDRKLLIKNFYDSNDEEETYTVEQINTMLGSLVAKRLNAYNDMEKRVAHLEKENEILRRNAIGIHTNTDLSSNTFDRMQKEYIETETLAKKQAKQLEILTKAETRTRRHIEKVKERVPIMQKRISKIIDDYTFLDKFQLTDPRVVNKVKSDIDDAVRKTVEEILKL